MGNNSGHNHLKRTPSSQGCLLILLLGAAAISISSCSRSPTVGDESDLPKRAAQVLEPESVLEFVEIQDHRISAEFKGDAFEMAERVTRRLSKADYVRLPGRPVVTSDSAEGFIVLTWTPTGKPGQWRLDATITENAGN